MDAVLGMGMSFLRAIEFIGKFSASGQIHPRKRHQIVAFAACFPDGWNEEEAAV
jgi:hypothetical protein